MVGPADRPTLDQCHALVRQDERELGQETERPRGFPPLQPGAALIPVRAEERRLAAVLVELYQLTAGFQGPLADQQALRPAELGCRFLVQEGTSCAAIRRVTMSHPS